MTRILYLGDEATAAGFRLAGVETRVTSPREAADALREALAGDDECVLLSGRLVDQVPASLLAVALQADTPLFAVIPDVRGEGQPPDLAGEVRNALGIDA
jgi:vacuolar-type H+-ATPase subunit F/Vma7